MLRFLVRRVLGAIVILILISAVTYFLFFALPSDPARLSCGKVCTPTQLSLIRHNMGLDQPIWEQYWHYMVGIFAGRDMTSGHCSAPCLGFSFASQQPVWDIIKDRYPDTLTLAVMGAAIFLIIGVGLGLISAAKQGGVFDKVASAISLTGQSVQIYFIGPIAIYLFADTLGWLPHGQDVNWSGDPVGSITGMLLPALVMSVIFWSNYSRQTRSLMVEQLQEEHVRTARAKGMGSRYVFFRYALRGAMGPIITIFGIDLGSVFGGAIITESTFGLHGIGQLAVQAVLGTDLPLEMGVMLFSATSIVIFNVIIDASYAFIDPRIRLA
ncbi:MULTISPECIES: ABC transporter permease [Streptomycetaceae]|uniref:BldKC, ABC transport system integral membrane protein n=1 Tax=Streptantibioticus cattleyicolor (strain ATCC 35852 / DSM 46488 / JCM 4925 / NBRC 14057 / NRRL 8057) TaxID=1003195 RepID=F8K3L5_STREN|nr:MULTISPECIES: ABC transporter permease [Streptomycetaceae]AEW96333.1 BldKC, ABC transport system integral membrane protein [Streptantibioticus cattleyicolor NRRL 8057 = DSM 46488]MYS60848.1 ABC transporter permease subunit [Streptomyces sp. SID5468]CCB76673.1 putative BldKC, ABC transport system integral membrane protein [Streptantibioticus cattleyicolor NRRL 8057 = DSM 46488]